MLTSTAVSDARPILLRRALRLEYQRGWRSTSCRVGSVPAPEPIKTVH
jgi:hypothetical protein